MLLSLFGAGAGVVSFFLLRAGYGFVVWGVLPFLALVVVALVLGAAVWRLAGGKLPGMGDSDDPEEKLRRKESRGGDDV